MRTSTLKRKTPMRRGTRELRRTPFRKSKPKARPGHDKSMLAACRGEQCYLAIPGVCRGDVATVVPCHANWSAYGKGMGIKANDEFTVPGCMHCHRELDIGTHYSKDEKRSLWESAYFKWARVRELKLNAKPAANGRQEKAALAGGLI